MTLANEQLGPLTMIKISFLTSLPLGMKFGFIMLNLKQNLSQEVAICWQGYAGCLLGLAWNTGSFHAKLSNFDCSILCRSNFEKRKKERKKKKEKKTKKTLEMHSRIAQKNVLLLHDNAPSQTASSAVEHQLQVAIVVTPFVQPRPCPLPHPSPQLLRLLFVSRPEKRLAGNKYETRGTPISAVNRYLSSRSISWFAEGILKLPRR